MIHSQETERHCLAAALLHPDILADVSFIVKEDDFRADSANKMIYSVILDSLKKGDEISSFRVAEKINNAGVTFSDLEVSPQDYLEDLKLISITEKAGVEAFKDLKKISIRREIHAMGKSLQDAMLKNGNDTVDEIIQQADTLYAGKLSIFESTASNMFEDVFEDLEAIVEERGNNPVKDFGLQGPFKRINEIYGSLMRRGNINLVAARQNQGKTQFGQYYMMSALFRHDVPLLHLDMGEMSRFELQMRATTLLCQGKVSPDMLETGEWRQNPESTRIVRAAWPHVKKLIGRYFYKDVSELTPDQIIATAKRFYLSKVKHRKISLEDGLEMLMFYDYLKSFENTDGGQAKYKQEYQQMGDFMLKIKRLLQRSIPAALWTSLQVNRIGITGNKSIDQIDDTENVFGMSDRIIQQATHGALLRRLTEEELSIYAGMGNYMLNFTKARHLGRDRDAHNNPVRMPDGSFRKNCIFLEGKNFLWKEMGDLLTLKDKLGVASMATPDVDTDDTLPQDVPRSQGENVNI